MSYRLISIPAALACALALAYGCATQGPPPTDTLTRARTIVNQADKAGAQRYAAADLQRARDELSNAERANAEKKYDDARRYAEAAAVDADLASARASAGDAQRAAHEVVQSNETLRRESERSTNTSGSSPN